MCEILQSMKQEIEAIENENVCEKNDEYAPTLLNLPIELFLKICSFLDADFISTTLSKVCRRFEDILADIKLWKYWVNRRITKTYPALPNLTFWAENEVNWEEACIEIDKEYKKWTNVEKHFSHIVVEDVHFASVDSVLLANSGEICVSGGRDRVIALWKVSSIKSHSHEENNELCVNAKPEKRLSDAHKGWVWDLAADKSDHVKVIYSASWDNTVKSWDIETGLTNLQSYQCDMAALSVAAHNNLIYVGLFSKKILIFDDRVGPKKINSYKCHNGPVLALEIYNDKVASISEDKTLAIWDAIAGKEITSNVKMPNDRGYPVSISWSPAAMYIGDSKGNLHLVDPELFVPCESHTLWPEPEVTMPANRITAIHQGLGTMIACSDRGYIKFLYNSFPPEEYMSLQSQTHDCTKMQYQNGIMVVGTCNPALEFWIPADRIPAL